MSTNLLHFFIFYYYLWLLLEIKKEDEIVVFFLSSFITKPKTPARYVTLKILSFVSKLTVAVVYKMLFIKFNVQVMVDLENY